MNKIYLCFFWGFFAVFCMAQKKADYIKEQYSHIGELYSKYQREGKSDSVLFIAQKFYPIAQKSGNDSILQKAYNLLGNAYIMQSDFTSSLEYYLKSLSLAQKLGDVITTGIAYENASYAFYLVGNYIKGAEYGKKAVDIFLSHPGIKKESSESIYYGNLANAKDNWASNLLKINQFKQSLNLLLKGITYLDKANYKENLYFRSGILSDIGNAYVQLKNPKKVVEYFEKSTVLNQKWNILPAASVTDRYYADFLLNENKIPQAISVARKGLDAARITKEKIRMVELSDILQKSYDKVNKIDSANYFSKLMNAYRDSIFSSQKIIEVQNLTFKQQNDEHEAELEKEKLAEERKDNLQYAAIGIGLLAFFMLYFIFSHSAKVGKRTILFLGILSMLLVFEFLNLLLHPYLGKLTHHQPFWMLLCMVAIAALLISLHHKLEHFIIHKLVSKNEKIRLERVWKKS
ncbi:tetratricopeptide repeat protein [Rhizosphaericola mali]|uniref:Tetratricopeptide repeat protein n=1 Tax=Rhizosphaericola mali TaxID=2545455 RepID=A0A5P2GCB7_9BACT|nr:tetratricopeptide repeat protein [Rhizosphaericola mali]QES89221.1 hypothetical protein E0W69_011290 [Rhizosphaericola mali]